MPLFSGLSGVFNRPKKQLDLRTTRLRRPHHTPFVKSASASTASHRAFRDDREPPLLSGETGELIALICPTG
jgi:hypothetical protein